MGEPLTVGEILREARCKAGLTQGQIAAMTGVLGTHISRYERNEERIPKKRLELFAKALPGLDMNQLREAWTLVANPIALKYRDDVMASSLTVGQILKHARLEARLTQEQLAAMAGTWHGNINRYEHDAWRIPEKRLEAFKKALPNLDINKLREAWSHVANPILRDENAAARQLKYLTSNRAGTIVVMSGNETGIPTGAIRKFWRTFIRHEGNSLVFLMPATNESGQGNLSVGAKLQHVLAGKDTAAKGRTKVLFPVFPGERQQNRDVVARTLALNSLLHPLTTTLYFEPANKDFPCAGLIRTRATTGKPMKGDSVWMRAQPDFLKNLSTLMKATLWAKDRDQIMVESHWQ